MKTIKYIVSLAAVCMLAMSVSARTFEQGEKIYVNVTQSFDWRQDNAYLFLYVWYKNDQGVESNHQWLPVTQEKDNIYVGEIPVAGEYNWCIFIRKEKNTHDWNDGWKTQTKDSYIPDGVAVDRNLINTFWEDGEITDWRTYTPGTDKIADYAKALRTTGKEEEIHICSQALGGPYSLRAKLKADGQDYDYGNVQCHGWYKSTDGNTWSSVDGYAGTPRDGEGEQDYTNNKLPESGSVFYYYLHSSKTVGRRLIKLIPDATGCELDCKITFFGVASSEVNANDTTYTLDGMVAFGVPCGDLVIECDGKSKTIKADTAKSPQIFSIEGLRAATTNGKTTTATAKFLGNEGGKKTVTVNIPNVTQGITYKHIDLLVGEITTLNPAGADFSHTHYWYIDGELTDKKNKLTTSAINEANTTRYTYRELNPPSGSMVNMMSNGNYESDATVYGGKGDKPSAISAYRFWGQYPNTDNTAIDFYTNTDQDVNPSGWTDDGFAVVKNANNFCFTYAKVLPQEGDYFALFDAASDGEAGKKAWYATTGPNNPNLKLQEGTTYLFSFWAANINNYGEMDNAAKLQFQIEYNGKTVKLGKKLDLGSPEFRNNRWHQCSATFTADASADNVTISVINLNTNQLYTGNDFALDDIQFRAVSSPTRSVKMQEVFTVQTHEPHIYAMTATPKNMPCGVKKYDVTISVNYDNPKGKLVVKDLTANKTVFEGEVPTDHGDWDKKKTKTITYTIDDNLTPAKHEYKAYFDGWTKAEATASSDAPEYTDCPGPDPELKSLTAEAQTMDCDSTAYDVEITVKYINSKGLFYVVDETTGETVVSEALPPVTEALWNIDQTYTFTIHISGLDPKTHTYKGYFDGWESGAKTGSSVAPKFVKCAEVVSLSAEAQPMDCDSTAYDVKLTVEYVNPEGNLVIKDVTADSIVFSETFPAITEDQENKTLTFVYTTHIVGLEPAEHEFTAYFDGREDGAKTDVSTSPAFVRCAEVITLTAEAIEKGCDSTAYDVKLVVEYVNPDGNLVIKDKTTGKNVFDKAVAAGTVNEPQKDSTIIRVAELKGHEFVAYFVGKPEASASVVATAPAFVRCAEVITLTAEVTEKGCDSTAYDVKLIVEYVNPDGNLIIKDKTTGVNVFDKAVAAGTVNESQKDSTTIRVAELKDHEFVAYFVGKPEADATAVAIAPEFEKCCSDGLMYRKWDNVLFINNHDSLYVAFQWYKNDVKLEGETLQRLYTGLVKMAGTADLYHCELTLADGTKDLTCPHTFDECPSSAEASKLIDEASVSVRPTRVAAGAAVTVSKTTEEAMTATLRTMTGQLISTTQFSDSESTMAMPNNAGVYLLQLQGKETNTTVKIHVY